MTLNGNINFLKFTTTRTKGIFFFSFFFLFFFRRPPAENLRARNISSRINETILSANLNGGREGERGGEGKRKEKRK